MNQITIIIIVSLFLCGVLFLLLRSSYLKKLNKALKEADFEKVQMLLNKPQAMRLLNEYLRDLYQARVYYLAKDDVALSEHLREMMKKSYEKANDEQYLSLYYHTFIHQGNNEMALEILNRIHQCENAKLIRYCDWTRDVLLNDQNDHCDEIIAAMDNKDYYGFPLGTCAYLVAVQKKRLEAYEEALQWFDAAKDILQKRDIYRIEVLKELDALKEMGYQMPERPRRKR